MVSQRAMDLGKGRECFVYPIDAFFMFFIITCLYSFHAFAAEFQPQIGLSSRQYATDFNPVARTDLHLSLNSSKFQGNIFSFFETGPLGDQSIDMDYSAFRFPILSKAHLWLGRLNPVSEGTSHFSPPHFSAVGSSWVQNQSNPLEPRVSGWLGLGFYFHPPEQAFFTSLAYSPIFLPTFGPHLSFTESGLVKKSRFGRSPPEYVKISNALVPLRYKISTGEIKDILFQHQGFGAVGLRSAVVQTMIFAWSSPSASPQLNVNHQLRIRNDDVYVWVEATPTFQRQNYIGGHFELLPYDTPRFASEVLYEMRSQHVVISFELNPLSFLNGGILHTFEQKNAELLSNAKYAEAFAWLELKALFFSETLVSSLRLEQHFAPIEKRGNWFRPKLEYIRNNKMSFFGELNIVSGQDKSYFGAWRAHDFFALGGSLRW